MIGAGSAKVIAAWSAKQIAVRPAKQIATGGLRGIQRTGGHKTARTSGQRRSRLKAPLRVPRADNQRVSARGISMHRLQEMVRLHRLGGGTSHKIAASLKMSPNTERRYRHALQAAGLLVGAVDELPSSEELRAAVDKELPSVVPTQQQSSIEKWRSDVKVLFDKGLTPKAIHDRLRLREPEKYKGKIGAVKRMVRRLRHEVGVSPEDIAIPVETKPGHVAQVDFGYAGYLKDAKSGTLRKAWVFVMVLGYSRHMYIEYVFDQRAATWAQLHVNAFKALGAVPQEVVPDNLKSAVIKAAFNSSQDTTLNRTYREVARHYGFKIGPTPPRSPKKKGKVEAGVKYVNNNFGRGRHGEEIAAVNEEARRWVREIAGRRQHGSTGREPLEVFEKHERAAMLQLPTERYRIVVWRKATVLMDSHFHFDGRLYSVPWTHVAPKQDKATTVWVRATAATVTAYIDDVRVTDHDRNGKGRRSTKEEHLPEHRRDHRHRDPDYWRDRATSCGATAIAFIDAVLDHDPVKSRVDVACACLKLLEGLAPERIEGVARHALEFGNVHYGELKRIVENELDLRGAAVGKAEADQASGGWASTQPEFARSGEEYSALAAAPPANTGLMRSYTHAPAATREVSHGRA